MPHRPDLGPRPLLGYADSTLARVAERRTDATFLAACEADARSAVFAIGGELVVLKKNGSGFDPLFRPDEARALAPIRRNGIPRARGRSRTFRHRARSGGDQGAEGPARSPRDRPAHPSPCRGWSAPEHLAPLAEGKALLAWHARHRFCSNCGVATNVSQAGWKRECPNCKVEHFPRTDPVVIMLAIDGDKLPARARGPLRQQHVVVPCGLHRAGREHRGCGAARDAGGSRHRVRRGEVFPLAALAVPDVADDRLPRAGRPRATSRSIAPSSRTRAGSPATRSR